jgi:hypothetical protein
MADPLSVTASAAGLVSLGLQVCSGITQYLDALKCRDQELNSARRYVQSLEAALQIINEASQHTQIQYQQPLATCLQPCQEELETLRTFIVELSNGDTANPGIVERAKARRKKSAYSFNRTKLAQLEDKLNRAVGLLQLAMQGLGM